MHISSHKTAAGLQIAEQRNARANLVEVIDVEIDADFVRNREQVQDGVGRSAAGGDAGDGVLDRIARDDLLWLGIATNEFHDHASGLAGYFEFLGIERRNAVETHRRDAEKLRNRRHRVGGELAAAGARTGTGMVFYVAEFGVVHLAAPMRAHGFEDVLNRYVMTLEFTGSNGATVNHQAGNVQPSKRHDGAGDRLKIGR